MVICALTKQTQWIDGMDAVCAWVGGFSEWEVRECKNELYKGKGSMGNKTWTPSLDWE